MTTVAVTRAENIAVLRSFSRTMWLEEGLGACLNALLVWVALSEPDIAMACYYAKFSPDHTMCVRSYCQQERSKVNSYDQQKIIDIHNEWRGRVATGQIRGLPTAANMRYIRWDAELAKIAQAHANLCRFEHDCRDCRQIDRFKSVGQNIFTVWLSSRDNHPAIGWRQAIDSWFEENRRTPLDVIRSFRFGSDFAHFTQAAWADTEYVGCGYSMYRQNSSYVHLYTCNYGSSGNSWGQPVYQQGQSCSLCPITTQCNFQGLCV
ncbi:CRISP/Allergen/PR-1-like isoform X2 [Varroa jacobsoni]|uniref:CRISP/Allergen/PR-1-like isoform X2 n=1 Tax=Varroa jacobsoni TaxID=62625 RepID=UPI000BF4E1E2|nr:CRISP/Allergen/PR-1-like isoform X2 [Varroa jacobsoni]